MIVRTHNIQVPGHAYVLIWHGPEDTSGDLVDPALCEIGESLPGLPPNELIGVDMFLAPAVLSLHEIALRWIRRESMDA